jgi:nicotinate-nucleotide adenylyltransferase
LNIGIFGGTFNPPHLGHLIVAEHVRTTMMLDKILFVPAAVPPHKMGNDITHAFHRMAMLRLAIEGNSYFDVSEIEINRGGVSFTIDTLLQLRNENPTVALSLLIGMDNLVEFHSWKSPDKILTLATVVVMTRPGFTLSDVPKQIERSVSLCQVPEIEIASRIIRKRVEEGKSIRYLVTDAVAKYITNNGLYRGS